MSLTKRIKDSIAYRLGYIPKGEKPVKIFSQKHDLISTFFNCVKDSGLEVNLVLDIGANRGGWTKDVLEIFPEAEYHLFEPQYWLLNENLVKDHPNVSVHKFAVSAEPGKTAFTIHPERDDSSTLCITHEQANEKGWKQMEIDVTTIDHFISENKLEAPEIIKVDAEGNDLNVIRGGKRILGKTEIILIEASVVSPAFENTLTKVNETMELNGYKLFDITDLNRPFKRRILWLTELAYIKKGGTIDRFYSNIDNINI